MEDFSELTSISQTAPATFHPLDARVITLWRWVEWVTLICVMLPILIGVIVGGLYKPSLRYEMIAGWLAITVVWIWHSFWYPARRYRAWGYRVAAQVLETRSGRLFQVTRLLPLNRLQHVDLQQGPFERSLGLARLILHTAGSHEASISVLGLAHVDAVRLRDHLVSRGGTDVN